MGLDRKSVEFSRGLNQIFGSTFVILVAIQWTKFVDSPAYLWTKCMDKMHGLVAWTRRGINRLKYVNISDKCRHNQIKFE